MKFLVFSAAMLFAVLSCEQTKAPPKYLLEEDEKAGLLVNFIDRKTPDVRIGEGETSVTGDDFHVIVQHLNGKYSGMIVKNNQGKIVFSGDQSGDGLTDVLISNTGERWNAIWDIGGDKPTVSIAEGVNPIK